MGELAYGERLFAYLTTANEAFLDFSLVEPEPLANAPHPDFKIPRFPWSALYPFAGLLSAASCRLFWTELGWIPALQAHLIVIPVFVSVLTYLMVVWVGRRVGLLAGLAAGIFLVLSPRFFAHSFNNLKDIPETCLYTFAMLAAFRALCGGRARWWILSGVMTGFALAQKANALFLPLEMGLFFALASTLPAWRGTRAVRWNWPSFAAGTLALLLAYFAVSPRFWSDPIGGVSAHFGEIFLIGSTQFTGFGDVGPHGYRTLYHNFSGCLHVLWTTPPLVLLLSIGGLFVARVPGLVRLFLAIAVAVPIGRTVLPGMRNFDGVRHFIEFLPPLCALAGIGLAGLIEWLGRLPAGARVLTRASACVVALLAVLVPTVQSHPNGVCYYNQFIGGLRGAREIGVEDATDYWCNSYWQALSWLNENAEADASLVVPIAGHIVTAVAPVKLRDDLTLDDTEAEHLYVMYVVRPLHYGPFLRRLEDEHTPAYEVRVDGETITRVHHFQTGAERNEWLALRARETAARKTQLRVFRWMTKHPAEGRAILIALTEYESLGEAEIVSKIQSVLPDKLDEFAADFCWLMKSK